MSPFRGGTRLPNVPPEVRRRSLRGALDPHEPSWYPARTSSEEVRTPYGVLRGRLRGR